MQIFVKNINGDSTSSHPAPPSLSIPANNPPAIPLIVPTEITHTNLLTLLSLRTSLPASGLRLVHAGKHLSPSSPDTTLLSQGIKPESTLHLAAPLRGGMPPKKVRCTHKDCREVAQRIVGDCGFCNGRFCGKHRLLEDHKCTGLEDVSSPAFASLDGVGGGGSELHGDASFELFGRGAPRWWLVGLDLEELGISVS
jgi:hypothetical protein